MTQTSVINTIITQNHAKRTNRTRALRNCTCNAQWHALGAREPTNEQTNKQPNKQTHKQTSKQANKQTSEQTSHKKHTKQKGKTGGGLSRSVIGYIFLLCSSRHSKG